MNISAKDNGWRYPMTRNLWKLIEMAQSKKMMVRFASFPGGHLSLGLYNHDQSKQYLYESKLGMDDLEAQVMKDFKKVIPVGEVKPSILSGMPRP